jgi:hypothetical protein
MRSPVLRNRARFDSASPLYVTTYKGLGILASPSSRVATYSRFPRTCDT